MSARASSSVSARATVAMKRERLISISWVISVPARSVRISFTESVSPLRLLVVPLMMLSLYRVGTQQRRMVALVNYEGSERAQMWAKSYKEGRKSRPWRARVFGLPVRE